MWSVFLASAVVAVALLYVPGFVLLRCLSFDTPISISISPAISIAVFSIIELLLYVVGIPSNAFSVGIISSSFLILVFLTYRHFVAKHKSLTNELTLDGLRSPVCNKTDLLFLALYLAIGLFAAFTYIVLPLDGPESFFQGWDNLHHLGDTKAFIDSADWNPLFSSRYAPDDIAPYEVSRSFYPSAYHVLCAAVATVTGIAVPTAINAVNTVLVGAVFATSMYLLMRTLFNDDNAVALGSVLVFGVPACPWDYLIYGPLFPNLMSMVLVPACMGLFIEWTRSFSLDSFVGTMKYGLSFILSVFAIVCAHPNGVFTLILVLAPYLSVWIWDDLKQRGKTRAFLIASEVAYWAAVILFWFLCREIPVFAGIVNTRWPSIVDLPTAIVNCVILDFFDHPCQPLMAALLVIGLFSLIRSGRGCRWLVVSYLLASFVYIVDASTDGSFKQIVAGYWYTDYHRTAPIVALLAVIIAAFGANAILRFIFRRASTFMRNRDYCKRCVLRYISTFVFAAVLFSVTFLDSRSLFGLEVRTPFGYQKEEFSNQYNYELVYYDVLTAREQEFCEKAMSVIPEGSLILNSPNDGSVFMYPLYGANLYYRGCSTPSPDNEFESSGQIRLHLDELAYSSDVQDAIKATGAEYLIQLDHGENPYEFRINYGVYHPEDWIGIETIDETTPGFELIMSDGDMRLYKIVI